MRRYRVLLAVVAIIAATGMAFATGQTEASDTAESTEAPLVRVLYGGWFGTDYNAVESKTIIEERTNTRIEMITVGWGEEYRSRQQVMMASGDYPDMMGIDQDALELRYVNSGALVPLSDYFEEYDGMRNYLGETDWNVMRHDDGKIYAAPSTTWLTPSDRLTNGKVLQYRGDWMEALGLEIPTTLEEYFEVARALALDDPDGNGRDDTYAFGASGEIGEYFDHIFGAFGVIPDLWFERDGEVVQGAVLPEAKEALIFANRMWEAGLLDPELITDNNARWRDKWVGGVYGAIYTFPRTLDPADPYTREFFEKNPEGEFVEGNVLVAEGHEDDAVGGRLGNRRGFVRTAILKSTESLDGALRLLDFYTSKEGMWFYNFGIEGEHYEVRDDGTVNLYVSDEERARFGITFAYCPPILPTFTHFEKSPIYIEAASRWEATKLGGATDTLLVEAIGEYGVQLEDFINDEYVKMIVGETPIDGGFEEFVSGWEDRGGRETYEALNAAYRARQ